MISYQWDKQETVKKVVEGLKSRGIPCDGMHGDINDSMAEGVDNCKAIVCFMSDKYSSSKNCKRELTYADTQDKPIVPCMADPKPWKQTGWLGIITAGLLYINFRDDSNLDDKIDSLASEILTQTGRSWLDGVAIKTEEAVRPEELNDKTNRAFKHANTGEFLCESGQVKFHNASGHRSTLVLSDTAKDTSFWVEERKAEKDSIIFFKNFSSNGYLGYDPNGDYIYTKAQHYGAEEWVIENDENDDSGRRAVVIFAIYGKRYLAIKGGKLTGVKNRDLDCKWFLE